MDRKILKDIILKNRLIDEDRLRELDSLSMGSGTTLLETITKGGYLKEEVLFPLVAGFLGIEWADIEKSDRLDPALYSELPSPLKEDARFLPLFRDNGRVAVAVFDPLEVEVLDRLRKGTGWKLKVVLSGQEKMERVREAFEKGGRKGGDEALELVEMADDSKSPEDLANEAPIIKLVNLIIMQAISEGASDIHIEPYENKAVVRYRVDGILKEIANYPRAQYPAIISRIKIMADLNIAERRIPQDGRISLKLMDRMYDLRVAVIPTLHGEGVVIRILDKGSIMLDLRDLGFFTGNYDQFNRQIKRPNGIILVTGPTGSGKTTTLYAALSAIKSVESKIITIEDPVEYYLEGVSQIHVNAKVGLTFAAGLRSILRLDPDIVMVGEIRDAETAEIAIRAALTGHLVLSTLHTNDAPSSVTRIIDMGIQPYLISSSLNAVLAQRLVRKICAFCKKEIPLTESAKALLTEGGVSGVSKVFQGEGCDECNGSGYSGRVGIHELFEVSEPIRELINQRTSADLIREAARKAGMTSMRDDGIRKVISGVTTSEEVIRVTQTE